MIAQKRLSNSVRKFIRSEKARIRAQFLDSKKQEKLITELYKKVLGQLESKELKGEKQNNNPPPLDNGAGKGARELPVKQELPSSRKTKTPKNKQKTKDAKQKAKNNKK